MMGLMTAQATISIVITLTALLSASLLGITFSRMRSTKKRSCFSSEGRELKLAPETAGCNPFPSSNAAYFSDKSKSSSSPAGTADGDDCFLRD